MTEENDNVCQTVCVNEENVKKVSKAMLPSEKLLDLAELFKILGDHTRVRILHALFHSELCVCDLASILKMNQSAISHQLRVLRSAKIVKFRKEGKNVYYNLDDDHVKVLMNEGLDHVQE
jgi:ArsR family transcriptional regulator